VNVYTYDEIAVGQEERFTATLYKEQMALFAQITGDLNPRHTEQNVVYGMLTGSFLSTLAGMYLPGKYSLIQTVRLEFLNPAIIPAEGGLPITVSGTVTDKEDRFRLLTLKVSVCGEDGTKFLSGSMKVKVTDDA